MGETHEPVDRGGQAGQGYPAVFVVGVDLYNQCLTGVFKTLNNRATDADHVPCVLIYDARGNGGGRVSPTITGDHQDSITDYTAIVVQKKDEEDIC